MGRRGRIHFRGLGMRCDHKATFCVSQVHQDHVQIIDEDKQTKWNALVQSPDFKSTHQGMQTAAIHAQEAFDHCKEIHLLSPSPQSKVAMQSAARKLRKAQAASQSFATPDYHCDVAFDSIFSFEFALGNGLREVF